MVGQAGSQDFPTRNAFQPALAGFANAFLAKINPAGSNIAFSTYLGGNNFDGAEDVAVDVTHNIYVTGFTGSTNFPLSHAFQSQQAGQLDAFVTRFTPDGSRLVYSTFVGGSGLDFPIRMTVDAGGSASITGFTTSTDFPLKQPIHAAYLGGNADVFLTRLTPGGEALSFSTYLGGSGDDYGYAVASTWNGALWVAGSTSSQNLTTVHPFQAKYAGGPYDAFLMKIALNSSDAVAVLRGVIQNLAVQHAIDGATARDLEESLDQVLLQNESGDHHTMDGLRRFLEQVDEHASDRTLPENIVDRLRSAALDIVDKED